MARKKVRSKGGRSNGSKRKKVVSVKDHLVRCIHHRAGRSRFRRCSLHGGKNCDKPVLPNVPGRARSRRNKGKNNRRQNHRLVAEKWQTVIECERCLVHEHRNLCTAQKWDGPSFLITCEACGWNVRSLYDGRTKPHGPVTESNQ
jgi:hypothetical protein